MPPRTQCANPLFLQWLEELRDAAREKGMKSAEVYGKGCRSLQQCPIPYQRARDLSVLAGVGPKTIAELDKKHRAHCAATGEVYPSDNSKAGPSQPGKAAKRMEQLGDWDDGGVEEDAPPPPKKRRVTVPRTYIPVPRSGAYGILIGMLVAQDNPDDAINEQLTRGEIVRHAQAFCESSYERSEKGTWVTAWNAMKTLVNKGYVSVQGMPHRYCLTHDGFDVAAVIRNMDDAFKDQPKLVPFRLRGDDEISADDATTTTPAEAPSRAAPSANTQKNASSSTTVITKRSGCVQSSTGRFNFYYIDVRGRQVDSIRQAKACLCPVDFITLRRIEFLAHQRTHPIVNQLRLIDETDTLHPSGRTTLFAYIVEEGAPPKCSGFGDDCPAHHNVPPTSPLRVTKSLSAMSRTTSASLSATASATALSHGMSAETPPRQTSAVASTPRAASAAQPSRAPSILRTPSAAGPAPSLGHRLSAQMPLPGEHRDTPSFNPADAIVFPEGSYEIILVLDTREVESKDNRDKIQETLERKGVKVETRALRLGDMCWVARRKDSYGAEDDECVLDFVAERKRLDDLCISIKDGRYSEQCFRLGESGIKNIFYIVEDYQKQTRMQFFGKAILTAKSQIQVINGFYLKETHKLNDTIDYLVTMTNVIKSMSRDLKVIPSRYIHRDSYSAFQKKLRATYPSEAYLTSFEAFQTINKKSSLRTVHEYLARMLLRIKGMSPERVSAVLDVWETPRALYEAMRERSKQGARLTDGHKKPRGPEFMFADEVPGEGRRQIGNALSKEMWRVLWGNSMPAVADEPMSTTTTNTATEARAGSAAPRAAASKGKRKAGADCLDALGVADSLTTTCTSTDQLRNGFGRNQLLDGATDSGPDRPDSSITRNVPKPRSAAETTHADGTLCSGRDMRAAAADRVEVIVIDDDDE